MSGEHRKEKPRSFFRNYGVNLVVEFNTTPNAHPEVMRKWAEKINISE